MEDFLIQLLLYLQAPHPFYKPNNDLVPCKDPLCAALHHADYKCESPEQCDYQVDYADGGSSLGVLLNDLFTFNMTSGARIKPHLALGLSILSSLTLYSFFLSVLLV